MVVALEVVHLVASTANMAAGLMAVGLMAAKSELLSAGIEGAAIAARGDEYDAENDCVVVRQAASRIGRVNEYTG